MTTNVIQKQNNNNLNYRQPSIISKIVNDYIAT